MRGGFPIRLCLFLNLFFRGPFTQAFNLPKHRHASRAKVLLRDGYETNDAARSGHVKRLGDESLEERHIALVGCGLHLGGESGDGEDIGWVERAGEDEAGGVGEGDDDGGGGALEAVGEVGGEGG